MNIIICILIAMSSGVLLYFGKRWINYQELLPIISEVARLIIQVEKDYKKSPGVEKLQLVENLVSKEVSPEEIKLIKKCKFTSIAKFIQYVFTTVAEPLILSRLNRGR